MPSPRERQVRAVLEFEVIEPTEIVCHLKPADSAGTVVVESLDVTLDGAPLALASTVDADYGGTLHVVKAGTGRLNIDYQAELTVADEPPMLLARPGTGELERLEMSRPSRYCPSDHVLGFAQAEFGSIESDGDRVVAIERWIFERIGYVSGSTDVHDTAEHTLLTGQGVCRDFAHLGILFCRALDIPARFVAVYAPGLFPMDFHAVFEAWHDGGWWAYDATRLAPRQSLVRIGTGRDATDTSFASVMSGIANLSTMWVTATTDGDLPLDDHTGRIALA